MGQRMLIILCGVVTLLSVAITLPNFFAPRFVWASVPLAIRVRVTDRQSGVPISGARVLVPYYHEEAFTRTNGECEAIGYFGASGVLDRDGLMERSGQMHLYGTLQVSAAGYKNWEASVVSLFGSEYDYVTRGTSVTCVVNLVK